MDVEHAAGEFGEDFLGEQLQVSGERDEIDAVFLEELQGIARIRRAAGFEHGGGNVCARKAETMMHYGARVTIVSPEFTDEIEQWGKSGALQLRRKKYEDADGFRAQPLSFLLGVRGTFTE